MPQFPQTRIVREAISSPLAVEEYGLRELLEARESLEYRVVMNPRFVLRGKWFPRSLARKLRKFWDDFRAGKRPVLLLETPPQHGKSLSVIDFIAWAVGHDPHLRVIYTSFSDRLSTIQLISAFFLRRGSRRRAAMQRYGITTSSSFSILMVKATSAIQRCSVRSRERRLTSVWLMIRSRDVSRPTASTIATRCGCG